MQIVRDLAGYTLGRSDLVRRAMAKKKAAVMEKERQNFVCDCSRGAPVSEQGKGVYDMADCLKLDEYVFEKGVFKGKLSKGSLALTEIYFLNTKKGEKILGEGVFMILNLKEVFLQEGSKKAFEYSHIIPPLFHSDLFQLS